MGNLLLVRRSFKLNERGEQGLALTHAARVETDLPALSGGTTIIRREKLS
jgi:hypothetical protein